MNLENLIEIDDLLVEANVNLENALTLNECIFKELQKFEEPKDAEEMLILSQVRPTGTLNNIEHDYLRSLKESLQDLKTLVYAGIKQQREAEEKRG